MGVSRILKTLHFCATVSMYNFCSCFKHEEKLKAALNSKSVNCALHTEAIFVGLGKNHANLQAVVKICQLFNSKLSTINDSTNEILIPGAGIMEQQH